MKFALIAIIGSIAAVQLESRPMDNDDFVVLRSSLDGHPVKTVWNDKKPHPGFEANHDDFEGYEGLGNYDRQVPAHFSADSDDLFMRSMINNYALELTTPEGKPTGNFVFKKTQAFMAAQEVVGTHLKLQGKAKEDYLNKYFDKTWEHFDTALDGKIEASRMGGFFRFLCGNMQINLH